MGPVGFVLAVSGASLVGGIVGSISGMGGGIIIVPVLTVFFGMPLNYAIGASIISVIATSSGAGSIYVKGGTTNVRVAMSLEVATASGAIAGALLEPLISSSALALVFGLMLLGSLIPVMLDLGKDLPENVRSDALSRRLRLGGSYHDHHLNREVDYEAGKAAPATVVMASAGLFSGLLGIGSGVLKVQAMEMFLKLPAKVSTATSDFMIGVTAGAAVGAYLHRGLVLPFIAAPVALSVLLGSLIGAEIAQQSGNSIIKKVFAVALGIIGVEMVLRGFGVG
jgi:uncharacterized membrane protein YfcA